MLQLLAHCLRVRVRIAHFQSDLNSTSQSVSSKQVSQLMNDTFATRGAVAHAEEQVPKGTDSSCQGYWTIVILLSAVSIRVYDEHPVRLRCRVDTAEEGSLVV